MRPFQRGRGCVLGCSKFPFFTHTLAGSNLDGHSLAWAELYLALAALIQRFNFEFIGTKAEDFECNSDQFVIGTKGKGVLKAHVRLRGE